MTNRKQLATAYIALAVALGHAVNVEMMTAISQKYSIDLKEVKLLANETLLAQKVANTDMRNF